MTRKRVKSRQFKQILSEIDGNNNQKYEPKLNVHVNRNPQTACGHTQ